MSHFQSKTVNRVDKKGRVSIPAALRAVLEELNGGERHLSLRANDTLGAIEGFAKPGMDDLFARLGGNDATQEERLALEHWVYGLTETVPYDSDGRVTLPRDMLTTAGIADEALFIGMRDYFLIWQPGRFARHDAEMRRIASGLTLPRTRPS